MDISKYERRRHRAAEAAHYGAMVTFVAFLLVAVTAWLYAKPDSDVTALLWVTCAVFLGCLACTVAARYVEDRAARAILRHYTRTQ